MQAGSKSAVPWLLGDAVCPHVGGGEGKEEREGGELVGHAVIPEDMASGATATKQLSGLLQEGFLLAGTFGMEGLARPHSILCFFAAMREY